MEDVLNATETEKLNASLKESLSIEDVEDGIKNLNQQSKRIQQLIQQVDELPDENSRELMQEFINEMLDFYGKGLARILSIISQEHNGEATKLFNKLIEDSFVSGLLLIHDLHPLNLETRLNFALQKVRPYMDSHGGNVELVSLDDGVAKLKLSGSCKGCASSSVTMELAIKQAIEENCPDLIQLEVEGVVAPPTTNNHSAKNNLPLIPEWKTIQGVTNMINGSMQTVEISGASLIICKVDNKLYAYGNNCPACDMPLSAGELSGTIINCRLGHKYDIQQAGKCTNDEELHLNPFPLINENGIVKVSIAS